MRGRPDDDGVFVDEIYVVDRLGCEWWCNRDDNCIWWTEKDNH